MARAKVEVREQRIVMSSAFVFGDPRAGAAFEVSPQWVGGLLATIYPGAMSDLADRLLDAAVPHDGGSMTEAEQREELAKLDAEIERLGQVEECLIESAFARGTDILRRSGASPEAVLGVRAPKPVVAARPARRPRPALAPPAERAAAE